MPLPAKCRIKSVVITPKIVLLWISRTISENSYEEQNPITGGSRRDRGHERPMRFRRRSLSSQVVLSNGRQSSQAGYPADRHCLGKPRRKRQFRFGSVGSQGQGLFSNR